jgi:F-type H+-transporting ATPase subunit gamma
MVDTLEKLRKKLTSVSDLRTVVNTLKVLAASKIVQYEMAVSSVSEYSLTVEQGLRACFRKLEFGDVEMDINMYHCRRHALEFRSAPVISPVLSMLVIGSDQGLVGQFNAELARFVFTQAKSSSRRVWAVGERVADELRNVGVDLVDVFEVPQSVEEIGVLVEAVLTKLPLLGFSPVVDNFSLIHQQIINGVLVKPVLTELLPLNKTWRDSLLRAPWPRACVPDLLESPEATLFALSREYLFSNVFRCGAVSMAAENAYRLAAMRRAEKKIDEMHVDMKLRFHQLRQTSIDEELFDVVSGFEALAK